MENDSEAGKLRDIPAQLTSEDGVGSDLYACHRSEAAFARLLEQS
jgi:hypothetical protein